MLGEYKKDIKRRLLARLLKGNTVTCNVCDHSFTNFLTFLGRINAQCPNCGSLERTRLIYRFITDLKLITPDTKLLHIAPDACFYHKFDKLLGGNYHPGDKFEPGYSYPKRTRPMDVTCLDFPDESFDGVICIHVLEHVPDDTKGISEMYRVLKKGGFAILQVPFDRNRNTTYEDASITDPAERKKHFGQTDHVRVYGTDYIERFLKPGFRLEHKDYEATIPEADKVKYVFKQQNIFLLRK